MIAIKKFTEYVIDGPYLLVRHVTETAQQGMTIYHVTRWVDCIASIAVLVVILLWVTKRSRQEPPSRCVSILRWTVILLLCNTVMIAASTNLLGVFPGYVGNSVLQWIVGAVGFATLAAWPLALVLLLRIRPRSDNAAWRIAAPLALPTVGGYVYWTVNYAVIVQVLGCGCNFDGFNANDFSALFFLALFLGILILMGLACRSLRPTARFAYIAGGMPLAAVLCWARLNGSIWL